MTKGVPNMNKTISGSLFILIFFVAAYSAFCAAEPSGEIKDGVRVVKVTAHRYDFKPDPIVVRRGERVRLEITTNDVAHGLAISDFKVNVAVPKDKITTADFTADKTGDFQINCSVYCGPGHGKMRGALKVVE